jgi:LacI family transcriptional regulator
MSAKNEITIYDIAEALSVSPSTVSRALTNGVSVHRETREKVLAKARDLGYRQNIFASNLRSQRTHLLGIVLPHINDPETANIVAQVELIAKQAGYDVIVSQSLNDPDIHLINIESLRNKRVDGLLVLPADFFTPVSQPGEMTGLRIPSVFLEAWLPFKRGERADALQHGAYMLTTHLISKGCRRVAYVATKPNHAESHEVFLGYRRALEAHSMVGDISFEGGAHFDQAMRKCGDLLMNEATPDGFIFFDEAVTAFSVPSLKENQLYIHGKKIEFINHLSEEDFYPLPTMRNEVEAAKVVANMLFTMLRQTDHIYS